MHKLQQDFEELNNKFKDQTEYTNILHKKLFEIKFEILNINDIKSKNIDL